MTATMEIYADLEKAWKGLSKYKQFLGHGLGQVRGFLFPKPVGAGPVCALEGLVDPG